jgi:hypothetical protein
MKETNVEYRPLHAHTASFALAFEMRSKQEREIQEDSEDHAYRYPEQAPWTNAPQ